ncbi:MAG TPA: stage II sporulation protein M [Candidatus Pacearchaeota archaeon]|nr:stage II sporulation protein M [Candidatus Pacearchaeota archaeon]
MLEALINPRKAEKGPWKMFFVGLVYASLSLLLVHWFFSGDPNLSNASGMLVVLFCIMFSFPFMYYTIKTEGREDEEVEGLYNVWQAHKDAIYAFMGLFLGFVVAFSFWNIVLQDANLLNFQIQTYCQINRPSDVQGCVQEYSSAKVNLTGSSINGVRLLSIIENNVYVMIFTLIFSLIFGAGALFILVWNASVIGAAVGIFTRYNVSEIPLGIARYAIHGFPEIAAYFITALAGGIFGVGLIKHGLRDKRFLKIVENVILLIFLALVILIIAALLEVYITPLIFR